MFEKKNHFEQPVILDLEQKNIERNYKEQKQDWSPYELNGGTVLGMCWKDTVYFAADKRASRGYSILSRNCTKVHQLTDKCFILSSGMYADTLNLWKKLDQHIEQYELNHNRTLTVEEIAHLLSKILYGKRFFPFYTFNIIVGHSDGKPYLFDFDAVGCIGKSTLSSSGNSGNLMQAIINNQFKQYN